LYGTFSVTSVLVLEVKTSGDVIWVRVDNLGESDPTLRFEKTIEGLRYRYRERDEDDAEDRARNKIRLDDYVRLFEVKKEFQLFHEYIREAVLGQLAYREVTLACPDGVVRMRSSTRSWTCGSRGKSGMPNDGWRSAQRPTQRLNQLGEIDSSLESIGAANPRHRIETALANFDFAISNQ
jgi:hypothetical protein